MKKIWNFFSSITLTIVLAGLICLNAAWGSLLTVRNPRFFGLLDQEVLFPRLLSGGTGELGLTLWVWLLILLTFLFSVNTFVCTADRVISILRQKRPVRSLYPHIVHAGFLIAVLGHFVGSVWGFRSPGNVLYMDRPTPVPHHRGLSIRLDGLDVKPSATGDLEYLKTTVTLIEDDEEILTEVIQMNDPLIYRGTAFYHMNQGSVTSGLVLGSGGSAHRVDFYGTFTSGKTSFTLGEIYPDFAVDSEGRPYSRSENFANPYVEITSSEGETAYLPAGYPGSEVTLSGQTIRLLDYTDSTYVVLTINRDPGILLIIAGSVVLVAGMVLLLLFRGERGEIVRPAFQGGGDGGDRGDDGSGRA